MQQLAPRRARRGHRAWGAHVCFGPFVGAALQQQLHCVLPAVSCRPMQWCQTSLRATAQNTAQHLSAANTLPRREAAARLACKAEPKPAWRMKRRRAPRSDASCHITAVAPGTRTLHVASLFAPCASSSCTTRVWPKAAARCRGVMPSYVRTKLEPRMSAAGTRPRGEEAVAARGAGTRKHRKKPGIQAPDKSVAVRAAIRRSAPTPVVHGSAHIVSGLLVCTVLKQQLCDLGMAICRIEKWRHSLLRPHESRATPQRSRHETKASD